MKTSAMMRCPKCEKTSELDNLHLLDRSFKPEWVGLTNQEIDSYFEDHGWSPSEYYYPVIKDIELRLKERNT
jgi:hypothetical protein